MRDWKKFDDDEICAIWKGYCRTEFENHDPLRLSPVVDKPIRLTPLEIIRLVENLFDRLGLDEKSKSRNKNAD